MPSSEALEVTAARGRHVMLVLDAGALVAVERADRDELLTSAPIDLRRLVKAIGVEVDLVEV